MFRPLWIEVDLKALRDNFTAIRKSLGGNVKIIATIKQQAYGHGLIPVARELSFLKADCFAVGSIEEAVLLRENGFKEPIITISAILPDYVNEIPRYKITPSIADLDFAKKLNSAASKLNVKVPVHVKIDTGMGRLGLYYKEAYGLIRELKFLKAINLEGIYTHFPSADTDPDFTNFQITVFNKFISRLKKEGITFKYQHCANSVGVAHYPRSYFNIVRPGLMLYGIKPSTSTSLSLKPVLSLKSKTIFIKKIKKGMSVSYGRTFLADRPTRIATVSIGYADGYPWALSNNAKTIIGDNFFNLVGRVCMDHIMVDLGNNREIKVAEEVTLIGEKNNLLITAEDMAGWAKTIPYEIVSRLSLKIPRLYKNASEKQLQILKKQF